MAPIFKVIIRCPETNEEIDTGIRTSGREVLSSNIYQNGQAMCNHCKRYHSYAENAFLKVDVPSQAESLWRPNP